METISASDIELLVFGGECKCESPHVYSECTLEVTHLSQSCVTPTRMICLGAASRNIRYMQSGNCAGCLRPASECWTITPI